MSKTTEQVRKSLAKRYRAERRFKAFGVGAIGFGLLALVLLFTDIIGKGHSAFFETYVKMEVTFDQDTLDISDVRDELHQQTHHVCILGHLNVRHAIDIFR